MFFVKQDADHGMMRLQEIMDPLRFASRMTDRGDNKKKH